MSQDPSQSAITRQDGARETLDLTSREFQALWFSVARLPWNSLVLVPADEGRSVAHLAKAMAEIGDHLSISPVTHIVAHPIDYKSAIQVAAGASTRAGWGAEQRVV